MVFRQFRILLWRCFIIKRRQPILTAIEIVLPIFMATFIALINFFDTKGERGNFKLVPQEVYTERMLYPNFSDIDKLEFPENEEGVIQLTLMYAPSTIFTTELMRKVTSLARRFTLQVQSFDKESIMIEELKNHTVDPKKSSVIGGVSFEVDLNMNNAPFNFTYTLYMTRFDGVNALFPKKMNAGPFYDGDTKNPYFNSFFVHVQCLVNEAYLKTLAADILNSNSGLAYPPTHIGINKYPYPQYINSPHIYSLKTFISRSNVIGFIALCPIILKVICGEKERRIKEMMKLMGMSDFFYYSSIFVSHFMIAFVSSLIMCGVYFFTLTGSKPLLQYASISIVFCSLIMYTVSLILFCIALSTFFNRPVSATVFTLIVYISTFELPHNLMKKPGFTRSEGFIVPELAHLWACLIPTVGMDWAFTVIVEMEVYLEGSHWYNLFNEVPSFEILNLGKVFLMIIFSWLIWFLIIWYFDAVWPWQYGVPQPLYFPFLPSYWLGHKQQPTAPSSVGKTPTTVDSTFFEADPPGRPVVVSTHIQKSFGNIFGKRVVVKDVSLKVFHGQITILLGHNGAGKTTTMNMLTGLLPPTSGKITIDGYDMITQTSEARRKIGLCPQHNVLYDELTVYEHLELYGALKNINPKRLFLDIDKVLDSLDLRTKKYTVSTQLSGGMKRKLSLAIAMIGEPGVLVLDEPTAGMDPEARRFVWDMLLEVRRRMALLVTTHHMEEADVLGDRIAIMAEGLVKCAGSSMFLKKRFGAGYHLVFAKLPTFSSQKFKSLITTNLAEAMAGSETNTEIILTIDPKFTKKLGLFFDVFDKKKREIGVSSCGVTVTTMEDVFLQVGSTFKNIKGMTKATFIKKPLNQKPKRKAPERKVQGLELSVQRCRGLLFKRFNYSSRYIPSLVILIVVPVVVSVLLMVLQKQMLNALDTPPFVLNLQLSLYTKSSAVSNKESESSTAVAQFYVTAMREEGCIVTLRNDTVQELNKYLLNIAKTDVNQYQKRHVISASFFNSNQVRKITAWYNGEALQSMPISINMVYKARQREIIAESSRNATGDINILNRPFPTKVFFRQWFNFPKLGRYLYLSFVPLSMAFVSSAYILFPVQERVSKAKLIQLMTGTNRVLFWLCHWAFDFTTHILACILVLFVYWAFDYSYIFFNTFTYAFGLFVTFISFGFAMIPLIYILSFACDSQSTGFALVMLVVLICGLLLGYIIFIFEMLLDKTTIKQYQYDISVAIARLFPPFSLSWAVQKMFYSGSSQLLCEKISDDNKKAMCSVIDTSALTTMGVLGCCRNKCEDICYDRQNPFHTSRYGIIGELLALIVNGFIFWFILILIECNFFVNLRANIHKTELGNRFLSLFESTVSETSLPQNLFQKDDDDVVNERNRVKRLIVQRKMATEAIVINDLTKRFHQLTAVDKLTLAIHKEEFFGFLGINGAGKTTTFSILTGDSMPTAGNAYIDNCNLIEHPSIYCQQIGYCPQFDPLLDRLTGREMLSLIARLRGIQELSVSVEVNRLLKLVDLEPHADKQTMNYSGGNQRKLSLAMAIVGSPKVVFLDEPTAGVDAESRRKMWSTLTDLQAMTGCAIVLTSHTMDECEALCNRITIMVNGKFRCLGSIQHLRSKFGQGFTVIVKLKQERNPAKDRTAKVKAYFLKMFPKAVLKDEHSILIHYHVDDKSITWAQLFRNMEKAKTDLNLEDYQVGDTTLEQIFLAFARGQRKEKTLKKARKHI